MRCTHCQYEIRSTLYEDTWIALLALPGERAEDVPHFHRLRRPCYEEGLRQAAVRGLDLAPLT